MMGENSAALMVALWDDQMVATKACLSVALRDIYWVGKSVESMDDC
jgi:hypothetical protein